MKHHRVLVLASLVASIAFAASAAGASAHEFIVNKTGTLESGPVENFTIRFTAGSSEEVICKKLSVTGSVTSLKSETLVTHGKFSECESNTFLGKLSATDSETTIEFDAFPSITLFWPTTFTIGAGLAKQTIEDQGPKSFITYTNVSGKLEVQFDLVSIISEGSFGRSTDGTITGKCTLELIGGTLEWK